MKEGPIARCTRFGQSHAVAQHAIKGGLFVGKRGRVLSVRKNAGDGYTEHQHQVGLVCWARDTARLQQDPAKAEALNFFHAIPNGAFLGQTRATYSIVNKLKAEGLTPGITDLRMDYVVRDQDQAVVCPGLAIEMKRRGQKASPEQQRYLTHLKQQGYRAEICRTWQEGARLLVEYLGLTKYAPICD